MTFILIVIVLGIVLYIVGKVQDAKRSLLHKEIDDVKRKYPLAYNDFVKRNHIATYTDDISTLERITSMLASKSSYEWNKEEGRLMEAERRRKKTESDYRDIASKYPKGLAKWEKENTRTSKEATIANRRKIIDYEKIINATEEYNKWEKEQAEFSQKCRNLFPKKISDFGWYIYNIPFKKKDEDGCEVEGKYSVWQAFAGSYCLEEDLDYIDFEYIAQKTRNIGEFKKKERNYVSAVYEKVAAFISELAKEVNVSVYLCANNSEWDADALHYHYSFLPDLPPNVELWNDAVENDLLGIKPLDHSEYPELKNRHIVVIEMQTGNDHLKEVCQKLIEKNKEKRPLITYISLLKGYDRAEMQELIEKKKKEKAAEEEKKRKEREAEEQRKRELEKYKPCKDEILKILGENNIKCFYHFTSIGNIDSIKKNGGLYSWWNLKQKKINVPFIGGEGFGQQLDMRYGLQDYVRLSFCDDHPMVYRHQQNGVQLVLLEIDVGVATWKDTLFSDINATDNSHHHGGSVEDLKRVNFKAVKRNYVSRTDDDFKPHQAEVMVKTFIPIEYIKNIDSPLYL